MAGRHPVRINVRMTEDDSWLLARIMEQDGDSSVSSVVRRLIRQEAKRRGDATTNPKRKKGK